jgi:DNA-binding PadR family transcriptional regulator
MSHWERYERDARRGHRLERGDLRFVILDLLEEHPSYGYELIHALEERFHGFYSPSPGTIYPTLQWLEDLGYVTVSEQDGRKMYAITDEGRRFLAASQPRVDEIWTRLRGWWSPFDHKEFRDDMHDFMHDMQDMVKDLRHEARWADPDKLRRVREVVMRAGREIDDILREPPARPGPARPAAAPGPNGGPGPDDGPRETPGPAGETTHGDPPVV